MTVSVVVTVHEGEAEFNEQVICSDPALNSVLFDFNPSSNPHVTTIKALHAGIIQVMRDVQAKGTDAQKRCAAIAITELEGTQMRAVKALFAK